MTLNEAINHLKETLNEPNKLYGESREEHKQLLCWLEELREYKQEKVNAYSYTENLSKSITIAYTIVGGIIATLGIVWLVSSIIDKFF